MANKNEKVTMACILGDMNNLDSILNEEKRIEAELEQIRNTKNRQLDCLFSRLDELSNKNMADQLATFLNNFIDPDHIQCIP